MADEETRQSVDLETRIGIELEEQLPGVEIAMSGLAMLYSLKLLLLDARRHLTEDMRTDPDDNFMLWVEVSQLLASCRMKNQDL